MYLVFDEVQDRAHTTASDIYSTRDNAIASGNGHVLVTDRFSSTYPELTELVVTALVRAAGYASQEAHRSEVLNLWGLVGEHSRRDL